MTREQFETGIKRTYIVLWFLFAMMLIASLIANGIPTEYPPNKQLAVVGAVLLGAVVPPYLLQLVVKFIYFGFYPKNQR